MRWLIRMVVFWLIAAPLGYFYGIPYAITKIEQQTRIQTYDECQTQHKPVNGPNPVPALTARTDAFCHCLSDTLTFTRADLWDAVHKRPPAALGAQVAAKVNTCAAEREQAISTESQAPAPAPVAYERDENGREIYNFR